MADRNNRHLPERMKKEIYPILKEIFKNNEKILVTLKYKFKAENLGEFDIQELYRLGFSSSEIVDFIIMVKRVFIQIVIRNNTLNTKLKDKQNAHGKWINK